ncbi:SulP family inorganic anion transporter [Cupriavidus metallidurans]|uniref:Sulphate transporter n=1 Tax=Cupriavidus metallidurans (strain ATCC 43123 / DSM 2839 / NBRC 102507 / CH34) TaxID=266264 RepID=Q1LEC9_CUPMC|nr:sulphate transporter [Cupriavidus metallidurans CH34]
MGLPCVRYAPAGKTTKGIVTTTDSTHPTDSARDGSRLRDLVAGCSIAGLLLPEAVAYAGIANLPPQAGLIGLLVGLVVYGLAGTSRFAVVSATSSSAAVLAAITLSMSGADPAQRLLLAAGLVILSGFFLMLAGLAKLGGITEFIAKPVLRGFTFGLAITIILKQLASVVGVHPAHNDLPRFTYEMLGQLSAWNVNALIVALVALALLFGMSRWKNVPGPLVVIVLGIAASHGVDLHHFGIGQVGTIDLADLSFSIPDLSRSQWLRLGELAFALVLILYAESYSSIRSFALKHGDSTSADRDLLALGFANLGSGLLHGMPVGAGYSATSANEAAGATSRLAGWCAAVVVAVIVALLLPQLALTPEPVLAAIVAYAVSHTLRLSVFRPYWSWQRDRLLVVAACVAVLLLGVLDGLLAGIVVSLLLTLRNFSEPRVSQLGRLGTSHNYVDVSKHPEATIPPGLLIARPEAPLFFANVERILLRVRHLAEAEQGAVHTVIISLEETPDLDGSTIEALRTFAAGVASRGRRLLLVRLKPPALDVLTRSADDTLPLGALHELSVDEAVQSLALESIGADAPAT